MLVPKLAVILVLAAWADRTGAVPRASEDPRNSIAAVAGDYYFGDGLGVNCTLAIKPEGRFSFGWRGCLGVYDQNAGAAIVQAGHLLLVPEKPNRREGFSGTPTYFHTIRWGERLYLVPEEEKQAFCNAVNSGREPRTGPHGMHYIRRGDWEKKVAGLPEVPLEWRELLLNGPLKGRIVEVLPGGRARVNLGANAGVQKGMEFWMDTKGLGLVKVVDLDETSCVIAPRYADMVEKEAFRVDVEVRSRPSKRD